MPTVAPPNVVNISDLRRLAKRRLPRAVFDYIDGGADGEVTLGENTRVFDTVTFRPRCAVAVPRCEIGTTVLGVPVSMPILLAPVGSSRMFYPRGEEAAAHDRPVLAVHRDLTVQAVEEVALVLGAVLGLEQLVEPVHLAHRIGAMEQSRLDAIVGFGRRG